MTIVKIGNVELTEAEALRLYEEGRYIVTGRKIYALHYSNAQRRVYGSVVYQQPKSEPMPLIARGRFHALCSADVNRLIGAELLNE